MNSLNKLLVNANTPLSEQVPNEHGSVCTSAGLLTNELLQMLRLRNGFYAFESALHVFPSHSSQQEMGLNDWNENSLWRDAYKGFCDGCLFFAEDIFGGQFCIKDGKIYIFDPETGLQHKLDDWGRANKERP